MRQSQAYIHHRLSGPFPGQIDPWAEMAHYFSAIHGSLIGNLVAACQVPLQELGYEATRESSLQILESRKPDVLVIHPGRSEPPPSGWSYAQAASAELIEPGIQLRPHPEDELDAIYIRETESGLLVTVVEIVSPGNKINWSEIEAYQERRTRLVKEGVNVVEVDLTRSIKRLVEAAIPPDWLYHIALHLRDGELRLIGMNFGQPIKRFALPLLGAILPVALQPLYDQAYQAVATAGRLYSDDRYTDGDLPFPSLLTVEQRQSALATVKNWSARLESLRTD
jgi:hypothetical protein